MTPDSKVEQRPRKARRTRAVPAARWSFAPVVIYASERYRTAILIYGSDGYYKLVPTVLTLGADINENHTHPELPEGEFDALQVIVAAEAYCAERWPDGGWTWMAQVQPVLVPCSSPERPGFFWAVILLPQEAAAGLLPGVEGAYALFASVSTTSRPFLAAHGHRHIGNAATYEEARQLAESWRPDDEMVACLCTRTLGGVA